MGNQDWKLGLREETIPVFEAVSQMESVKGLYLCGGTAQSLQMQHRKSEDLDFELLGTRKERPSLDFSAIANEVSSVFPDCRKEFLGKNQLQIFVDGNVKLSFFRPENSVPELGKGFVYNNIVTPSLQELLGMKLFTIAVRSVFRTTSKPYNLENRTTSENIQPRKHTTSKTHNLENAQLQEHTTPQPQNPTTSNKKARRIKALLSIIGDKGANLKTLMEGLRLRDRKNLLYTYINPNVEEGNIAMLYPEKPNHPMQSYYLTQKGRELLEKLLKEE